MSALNDVRVAATLERLHGAADGDMPAILAGVVRSFGKPRPSDMASAYIAVSRSQGRLLYASARAMRATNIVEFGASYGISALWLGAAARDAGVRLRSRRRGGTSRKAARGRGDGPPRRRAETLRTHEGPVDLLVLDGWNDLYFEILALMEPKLRPGAAVLVDNASFPRVQGFLRHLRESPSYASSTSALRPNTDASVLSVMARAQRSGDSNQEA